MRRFAIANCAVFLILSVAADCFFHNIGLVPATGISGRPFPLADATLIWVEPALLTMLFFRIILSFKPIERWFRGQRPNSK